MLRQRATKLELLDRPRPDVRLAVRSHAFMAWVNRHLGGTRMVRQFLAEEAARIRPDGPLRVLDIGSGSCDIPLAVSRWARRRGLALELTCVENSLAALPLARRALGRALDDAVTLEAADIFRYHPERLFHCAVGSMVFHHFADSQIPALVRALRSFVAHSLLINDLRRTWPHYLGAMALTALVPRGVRHDALLSIRRGFRVAELAQLLGRVDGVAVAVTPAWLFRVRAVVRFGQGGAA